MVTRSRNDITKPKKLTSLSASIIPSPFLHTPTCFTEAIKLPHWQQAMAEEFNALTQQHTWDLVPPNSTHNLIGSKWIFRVKLKANGTLDKYKAQLVAQGFKQQHGIDFDQTFSPVIKHATIRTVLTIAVSNKWSLRQLDVKNAFFNGTLSEVVYMKQPAGFTHPDFPTHHCKLRKSLYGLKQAPQAWFQKVSSYILSEGFDQTRLFNKLFKIIFLAGPDSGIGC
ncbi:transmembrane signal receptor [Lithospermum erythrorhizon]|uniref:Transmembrane signal receptor n=1 Tax=Lithospermum erythrorhizon TaxID=34254 RepID=A0AAV3R0B4_LITER